LPSFASANDFAKRLTDGEFERLIEQFAVAMGAAITKDGAPDLLAEEDPTRMEYELGLVLRHVGGADARSAASLLKAFPMFDRLKWIRVLDALGRQRRRRKIDGPEIAYLVGICKSLRHRLNPDYDARDEWASDGTWGTEWDSWDPDDDPDERNPRDAA
jgi:hypothetical protein